MGKKPAQTIERYMETQTKPEKMDGLDLEGLGCSRDINGALILRTLALGPGIPIPEEMKFPAL